LLPVLAELIALFEGAFEKEFIKLAYFNFDELLFYYVYLLFYCYEGF